MKCTIAPGAQTLFGHTPPRNSVSPRAVLSEPKGSFGRGDPQKEVGNQANVVGCRQCTILEWCIACTLRVEGFRDDRLQREQARWQAPRQSDADALQQAAEMVDRFNRIFLRTLRALSDLRRHGPTVIVKKGGQLNVAEQQVNLAGGGTG
jgi:hypothetical protein